MKKTPSTNAKPVEDLEAPEGMEVVQSKKAKVKQLIPVDTTYVYQSNKVTLSKYNSTLLLERLLTLIQYHLQDAVKLSMKGDPNYSQLALFDPQEDLIKIHIPLRSITKANSLDDVIATCKGLMDLKILFPSYSGGKGSKMEYMSIRQAVHGVDIPMKEGVISKGKNAGSKRRQMETVIISMTKDQADRFVLVDYDQDLRRPVRFTKFLLHVAINAKTKYTSKLYKLISSWQAKGKFTVKTDWLREYLDIKGVDESGKAYDLYPYYSDLVKRVLKPVRDELFRKADCWFEFAPEKMEGKKVVTINFTVITPDLEKVIQSKHDHIRYLLKAHFNFTDVDMKAIKGAFLPDVDPDTIVEKILTLHQLLAQDRSAITNVKGWIVTSLKNFLAGK
ncbi:replication initiation protein [Chitinophaga tropicalis]|uniref:RepB family plasmid replication initiator protein n=1 Tax=Chitinophaga tropicalis TaxID=2683588 RepID=A0A7K1UDV9_9BACT|nr:replication initiation protein [Chitinophaga tropicalis]MVT12523.1 RepB family plasmid replication initiator protein [Chitinophaga tropicalis]